MSLLASSRKLIKQSIRTIPGVQNLLNRWLPAFVKPGSLGLTTAPERQYYFHIAANRVDGRGAVIDLGSWLGSTTAWLAQGLAANSSEAVRHTTIEAYDLFTWSSDYDAFSPRGFRFSHGESFLPLFRANVRPWLKQIRIHEGDLAQVTWKGPVELILNDAAKSWRLAERIWLQFVTQLVEGGFLIEQDFKHHYCPWLHLVHFRFRQHFTLDHDVAGGATTAFRLKQSIRHEDVAPAFSPKSYDADECDEAFAWAARLVDAAWRPVIQAAHAMHYVHLADSESARRVFEQIGQTGRQHPDVRLTEQKLRELEKEPRLGDHEASVNA